MQVVARQGRSSSAGRPGCGRDGTRAADARACESSSRMIVMDDIGVACAAKGNIAAGIRFYNAPAGPRGSICFYRPDSAIPSTGTNS